MTSCEGFSTPFFDAPKNIKNIQWISNANLYFKLKFQRFLLVWSFLGMGTNMLFEVTQGCEVFTAAGVDTIESISTMKSLVSS